MTTDVWELMQLYWKLDQREVTGASRWRVIAFMAAILGLIVGGVISGFVGYGLSFLNRPEVPVRVEPGVVPGMLLTFVMLGVLITGLNQAVRSLFLSGDLDRLMVAPIHSRAIMVAKLLSRLPSNVLLLLLLAAPAFFAYGAGIGAGPVYFILGLIFLASAPLFGLAVGAILAMLLVRVLPVNRLNELLAAAYALMGILIGLLFQIPRIIGGNEAYESIDTSSVSALAARVNDISFPTLLAGRGLVALDAGRIDGSGLVGIALYLALTVGLFALLILTADKLYISGWLKTQSAGGKRRGLETTGGTFGRGSLAGAIGRKDWLLRVRDPRQLVNLLGGGLIAIVAFALVIFRGSGDEGSLADLATQGNVELPAAFAFFAAAFSPGIIAAVWALFIGVVFLMTPANFALAQEGSAFSLLKAAPIRSGEVWWAKMWSVFLPYLILFSLALLLSWLPLRYSLAWLPYGLAAGWLYGHGILASNLAAGFRFANLNWTDPRRMTTRGGGLVALLIMLIYSIVAGIVVYTPYGLASVRPQWSIPLALGGLLVLALLTWLWDRIMSRWALKAWDYLPA